MLDGNSLEQQPRFTPNSTDKVGQSVMGPREEVGGTIGRRSFLAKAALAVMGLIGLGVGATTRQTGGQLEPSNPSPGWLEQRGSLAEQMGEKAKRVVGSMQETDAQDQQQINNSSKMPLPEQKEKIMKELEQVNQAHK